MWLDLIYPTTVTVLFIIIFLSVKFKISRTRKQKLRSIKKRDIVDAVETDSPVDNQSEELKEKGIDQLEDKFSFLNKALPVVMVLLWGFIIIIPYLEDIPSVYISIIVAIVSVVAGFALRPFLENLFSGIIISFFKSIRIGDTVRIDGHYGLIEEIGLTYSVLKRWDWVRIVVPNSKLLNKEIQNLTMNDHHIWANAEFYVAPDSDLDLVEALAKEVAINSPYNSKVEEPSFWVMDLNERSIRCWIAAWANNPSDAWELRHEMRFKLAKLFRQKGIKTHTNNLDSSLT